MYRKDYILKMIEMMAEMIAGILAFIKKGEIKKANELMEEAYTEYFKEEAEAIEKMDAESLLVHIKHSDRGTDGLLMASDLLYSKAILLQHQGELNESKSLMYKSHQLLKSYVKETKTFSFEHQNKLQEMEIYLAKIDHNDNQLP